MAEKEIAAKESRTILAPDLSQAERAMLAQVAMLPGWKVLVKVLNDACARATRDIVQLDPESKDYQRVVAERQRRARFMSEFSALVVDSVSQHAKVIQDQNRKEETDAVDAVAATFGIHNVNKGKPADAIKNVFGIHPARPKKKEAK